MAAFDAAFAASKANMANVDFGHYVAGGNKGGTALEFLQRFHDRIASQELVPARSSSARTIPASRASSSSNGVHSSRPGRNALNRAALASRWSLCIYRAGATGEWMSLSGGSTWAAIAWPLSS